MNFPCNCPVLALYASKGFFEEDGDGGLCAVEEETDFDLRQNVDMPGFDNIYSLHRPYYYDLKRERTAYIYIDKDSAGIKDACSMEYDAEKQLLR